MCPMRLECKKWFGLVFDGEQIFYLEASHNLKTSHSHMDQTWILWFCSFIHNPFYRLGNRYFSSESGFLDHLRNLDKKYSKTMADRIIVGMRTRERPTLNQLN